jgi:hypothetical protein
MIDELDARGFAVVPGMLAPDACDELIRGYDDDARYRSTVVMARHGFGSGEYRYFAYPLPATVATLREDLYRRTRELANTWQERLGQEARFGASMRVGNKPTPLILKYGPGDYNRLHQDKYGDEIYPFQLTILLGGTFTGGEFVLTEQRPRMQSQAHVVPLQRGDAVVFAVNHRPVRGARGYYRAVMRHGVSTVHTGERYTLGVICHDAP